MESPVNKLIVIIFLIGISNSIKAGITDSTKTSELQVPVKIIQENNPDSLSNICENIATAFGKVLYEVAQNYAEQGLQYHKNSPVLYNYLGHCNLHLNNDSAARSNFTKSLGYRHHLLRDFIKINVQNLNVSVELLQLFNISDNHSSLAKILSHSDRIKQAIFYQDSAVIILKDQITVVVPSETREINSALSNEYNNLGRLYSMKGKSKKAIKYFKLATLTNPSNPDGNINTAVLLLENGRAVTGFSHSKSHSTGPVLTVKNTQDNLVANKVPNGSPDKFNQVQVDNLNFRSWTYVDKKTLREALMYCNRGLTIDPNYGFAYLIRAEIKKVLKRGDYCDDAYLAKKYGVKNVMKTMDADCW